MRRETLRWRRGGHGRPFNFLDFADGRGQVISGELPEENDDRREATLASPDLLAVSTLGQLAENPRVVALRRFIEGWYLSYLSATDARGVPDAGPMERLSPSGDNLSNVVQYLGESHPERLQEILRTLSQRVPRLEQVTAEAMPDGRLLLRIKDAPFAEPFLTRFASDGTLKMLAYLILLYHPDPLPLLGIEEPEDYLHPRLLHELAEECRKVSVASQVVVSTHSPFFVDALRPKELWAFERDGEGYTRATRAADMPGVEAFIAEGAQLGALWMEGHLAAGDPVRNLRPARARASVHALSRLVVRQVRSAREAHEGHRSPIFFSCRSAIRSGERTRPPLLRRKASPASPTTCCRWLRDRRFPVCDGHRDELPIRRIDELGQLGRELVERVLGGGDRDTDAGVGAPLVVVDPPRELVADARLARHVQVAEVLIDDRPELVDRDGLRHGHHPLDRFDAHEHAGGGPTDGRQPGETDGR